MAKASKRGNRRRRRSQKIEERVAEQVIGQALSATVKVMHYYNKSVGGALSVVELPLYKSFSDRKVASLF